MIQTFLDILKRTSIIFISIFSGAMLNGAIINVSSKIISPPKGFNLKTMEGLEAAMSHMGPKHFVFPFLAHALGTLVTAILISRFLKSQQLIFSMMAGLLFFLGGTLIFSMLTGILLIISNFSIVSLLPYSSSALFILIIVILISRFLKTQQLIFSMLAGLLFLMGGVSMVVMLPKTPIWFVLLDLLVAYIPMAYLGYKMAARPQS